MSAVIVDLECTCWEPKDPTKLSEIIEIGAVKFDLKTLEITDRFQAFIKPVFNPILTEFCTNLTTIQQSDVNSAHGFETEYNRFVKWFGNENKNLFCSWGYYDKSAFERDCRAHNLQYKLGKNHWNVKRFYEELTGRRGAGLGKAVRECGLEFEGTQHRALVDSENVARVLQVVLKRG